MGSTGPTGPAGPTNTVLKSTTTTLPVVAPAGSLAALVSCNAGGVLLSGGYTLSTANSADLVKMTITQNAPTALSTWTTVATNNTLAPITGSVTLIATIVCTQ